MEIYSKAGVTAQAQPDIADTGAEEVVIANNTTEDEASTVGDSQQHRQQQTMQTRRILMISRRDLASIGKTESDYADYVDGEGSSLNFVDGGDYQMDDSGIDNQQEQVVITDGEMPDDGEYMVFEDDAAANYDIEAGAAANANEDDEFIDPEFIDEDEEDTNDGEPDFYDDSIIQVIEQSNPDLVPSRAEKSLGLLTQRFMHLLQSAKNGIVDLNIAADRLEVKQKRRMYDITNVMEGIGLIEKKSKNIVHWKGGEMRKPGAQMSSIDADKLFNLKLELAELEREERLLETHLKWMKQSVKNVSEHVDNQKLAYTSQTDITDCFPNSTVFTVQAPSGSSVEVGPPTRTKSGDVNYQMRLKSRSGPAIVCVVNKNLAGQNMARSLAEQKPIPAGVAAKSEQFLAVRRFTSRSVARTDQQQLQDVDQPGTSGSTQEIPQLSRQRTLEQLDNGEPDPDAVDFVHLRVPETIHNDSRDSQVDLSRIPSLHSSQGSFSMSQDANRALLRLSPPPSEQDYVFNMGRDESVADLFND